MSTLDKGVVLIVDDESNAIKVLSAILENSGYSVLHALNVDNAIKIIKQHTIDAIISDIKMPGKDGYDFFEHVSE